jgi:ketosteroid isomerase-like protein
MTSNQGIVRAFLQAWGSGNLDSVADLVADDVIFDGPNQHVTSRDDYLGALGAFAAKVARLDILSVVAEGDEVMALYTVEVPPFGRIPTAEHFTITDGRIHTDRLIFDTGIFARPPAAQPASA